MVLEAGHAAVTRCPWRPFYGEMPGEIDYPNITLHEVLAESASTHPRRSVYDFLGHRRSYRSLLSEVKNLAQGLWALGVRPGHRVCTLLLNTPHTLVLLYAVNRIGAVLGVLDPDAGPRDVSHFLDDLQPQWAVVTEEHVAGFQQLATGKSIRGVVVASLTDYASAGRVKRVLRLRRRHRLNLGGLRGTVGVSTSSVSGGSSYELPPTFSWLSMRKLGMRSDPVVDQCDLHSPDQCAVVLYTGGSTDRPHGVMLSDRNLDAAARQMQLQGPILPGQKMLSVVPFFHGFGLSVSVHTAVVAGAETLILPHFTPRSIVKTFRRRRPEYLIGVPGFYAALLADRKFQRTRLSCLMGAFSGGDRISSHLLDAFEMAVRNRGGAIRIREGYGLTETVAACVTSPEINSQITGRSGGVGIPAPDTALRVVRQDVSDEDLAELPPGEVGELCVSGPTVMLGYLNSAGAGRIVTEDGVRWLRTGDLGRMDEDGFVYFIERMGRSVGSAGETVHPGIVEDALNAHPEVKQACVTIQDVGGTLRVTAHVVSIDRDLDREWMESTLREWCAQELDERCQPSSFVFSETLPHTRLGVVDYRRVAASVSSPRG
ncbi:MAG: class I adenylate-forming enzyme family protein [Spirochaetia bacterium]